jgi:cell division protein FtsZ
MPKHDDPSGQIPLREVTQPVACIRVIGVGGGGNNAVNRMIDLGLENVEFVSVDTDLQSVRSSKAKVKLQLEGGSTAGRRAALDEADKIVESLKDTDMVIITAGLGGETGTGIAPLVASAASALGVLTVGVVTLPFAFEGKRRMRRAQLGMQELLGHVDTLLVISNDDLLVSVRDMTFFNTFEIVDDVVHRAVRGLSGILTVPGVINRDFADIRVTMAGMGYAAMGTESRSGPQRASEAALAAMTSPPLLAAGIESARSILINIAGSSSLMLSEVQEVSRTILCSAPKDANTVCGVVLNDRLGDEIEVTIIATGFDEESRNRAQHRSLMRSGIEKTNNNSRDLDRRQRLAETQALSTQYTEPDRPAPPSPDGMIDDPQELTEMPKAPHNSAPVDLEPGPIRSIFLGGIPAEGISTRSASMEAQALDLALSAVGEYPFDENLLTVLDGPPFDLNLPSSPVAASPEADPLIKNEIAKVRQAAMAAYADIPTIETGTTNSKTPEDASFAQILEVRQQIHGVVETEWDGQSDEEETPLQGQVASHGVLLTMVPPQVSESVSKLNIHGIDETPKDRAMEGAGDSDLNCAQLNEGGAARFPIATPAPPSQNLDKLTVRPKKPTLDFNGRLNRKPDFSMGVE